VRTVRLRLKCDGTRAETRFRPSAKRTSPFKSAGESFQSTTGRRDVHISLQGLYCSCKPVFCCHVTLNGYPLHPLVSPSLLLPCVTVCHHISTGLYKPRGSTKCGVAVGLSDPQGFCYTQISILTYRKPMHISPRQEVTTEGVAIWTTGRLQQTKHTLHLRFISKAVRHNTYCLR